MSSVLKREILKTLREVNSKLNAIIAKLEALEKNVSRRRVLEKPSVAVDVAIFVPEGIVLVRRKKSLLRVIGLFREDLLSTGRELRMLLEEKYLKKQGLRLSLRALWESTLILGEILEDT